MVDDKELKLNGHGDCRGMSPNSQKNLGKGRLGNNHANRDFSITRIVKERLDLPIDERWLEVAQKGSGITWRQGLAEALMVTALKGSARAMADLLDRLEGKVTLPVSGDNGTPLFLGLLQGLKGYNGSSESNQD